MMMIFERLDGSDRVYRSRKSYEQKQLCTKRKPNAASSDMLHGPTRSMYICFMRSRSEHSTAQQAASALCCSVQTTSTIQLWFMPAMAASEHDWSVFSKALTEERCAELRTCGYVTVDNVFGEMRAAALRDDIALLQEQALLSPNETQFSVPGGGVVRFRKPHIFEGDMHDDRLRALVPELNALFHQEALVTALNAKLPELHLKHSTAARTLKVQYNSGGGGCFPWHYGELTKHLLRLHAF
jgi:hypothetical protein